MEIVLATSNPHKVQEINDIINANRSSDKECIKFILPPDNFEPIEDGLTFEENSKIKALEAWKISQKWALADDSGLCIKSLGGKPGIYSARYAETPQKRIERVLNEMQGVKDRDAEFRCAMTLINSQGNMAFSCLGKCEGSIANTPKGKNGFGYDPIFLVKNDSRTMAELSEEEKNKISHRSNALMQIIEFLDQQVLQG